MVAALHQALYPVLEEETDRMDRILPKQKDRMSVNIPLVFTAALLGVGVSNLLLSVVPSNKKQLQSHPMCGTTTGGKVRA